MDKINIIIICSVSAFILLFLLINLIMKKRVLRKLAEKYGKPVERSYDERDFINISQLFKLFPMKTKETVDDITWNDIQMPLLYGQMNHSISHIGDEYLYRHLRTQQYDELERLESHIKYFAAQPEERLKLQYAFNKINLKATLTQTAGHNFVAHLKDVDLIPKISIVPSAINMFLGVMLLLFAIFVGKMNGAAGAVGVLILAGISVFIGSTIYFAEFFLKKIQNAIPTFRTFNAGINAGRQIASLDSHIFDKELKPLIPVLKKVNRKSALMSSLLDICLMQNGSYAMLSFIAIFFGFYGFMYQWAVKIIKTYTKEAMIVYDCIGYLELCIGLSSYRKTLSYFCHPDFSGNKKIKFDELYHPLLKNPVTNSKTIDQKFIITGANASGKSTFVKTLAINAITAQNINICYAKQFNLHPACIYTAMNLSDDITTGDSFYMAEIKRLKIFLDSLEKKSYNMFFVDEILKGTNTLERIAASSAILRRFAETDNFFCLATHDTELTRILQHYYANYHFEETTTDTEINYDYKLYDGVTPGSNAIALLKVMRYDSSIVEESMKSVQYRLNTGEWEIFEPKEYL